MKAKKSLGQNFLHSTSALAAIVAAAGIKQGETVLEVGPGEGALTDYLLAANTHVIAVEKDESLVEHLEVRFKSEIENRALTLISADALLIDIEKTVPEEYKLVANIPYYITGAILRKFLGESKQPKKMVVLVQKEVAERIARSKKESILSLSVKCYGTPRYIKTVPAKAFRPVPKVDSAILLVDNISRDFFADIDEKTFFDLVKKGFAHKRKFLFSNLGISPEITAKIALQCSLSPKVRAEELSLGDWKCVLQQLL